MAETDPEIPPDPDESPPERLRSRGDDEEGFSWHVPVAILLTVGGLAYLVVDGLSSETYFFSVDELVAKSQSMTGHEVRVKGKVVEGSVRGDKGTVGRDFEIRANGKTIRIEYDKALPDTFEEDAEVVATGYYQRDGRLEAERVLVKCPSRYEGKPPTAQKSGSRSQPSGSSTYGE